MLTLLREVEGATRRDGLGVAGASGERARYDLTAGLWKLFLDNTRHIISSTEVLFTHASHSAHEKVELSVIIIIIAIMPQARTEVTEVLSRAGIAACSFWVHCPV